MTPEELKARTNRFASGVVAYCIPLLDQARTRDIARQLLRSATAVDSNYGSAQLGRSHKEFTARLGLVMEEANESRAWLVLLKDTALVAADDRLLRLADEASQLTRIFAAAYRTAKANQQQQPRQKRR